MSEMVADRPLVITVTMDPAFRVRTWIGKWIFKLGAWVSPGMQGVVTYRKPRGPLDGVAYSARPADGTRDGEGTWRGGYWHPDPARSPGGNEER